VISSTFQLLKLADRFSLETPGNKQHPGEEEEDADELDRIRARRLEQMKSMAKVCEPFPV
jgi:hypothetical protein